MDIACGFDKLHGIVVVLFDTGGDRKDIRIENDIVGIESDAVHQQVPGALANRLAPFKAVSLSFLIKGHDHHGRTVTLAERSLFNELRLASLQADGVDDRFALNAFEPGFDDRPFGGVDHDRHAGDVRL